MRRIGEWVVSFVACVLLGSPITAWAQSAAPLGQTAAWVLSLRNDDGGYGATPDAPSTLGATNSAIRALKYNHHEVPDPQATSAFVASCFQADSGGFAQKPGGEPDVATTAVGLMAVVQLGMPREPYLARAREFLHERVKSFEDVRIAVAGLENLGGVEGDDLRAWTGLVLAGRNTDGTWGEGDGKARATGSAAVALLRLGQPLEPRDAVLAALRDGQRSDGGWADGGKPSDLGTSYRVMRAFAMLGESPASDRLRDWIQRHRTEAGGFAPVEGGAPDVPSTYYAAIILHWLDELDAKRPGPVAIFNGRDLEGWEGDTSLWTVDDGSIVGKTATGLDHNEFLATDGTFGDFVLTLRFRVTGDESANSGIMFRAQRVPDSREMSGYQADIGQDFWGCLYDESRRNRVLVQAAPAAAATVKRDDWNTYEIRAQGGRVDLSLNGVKSVHYHEPEDSIPRDGRIALQVHAGQPLTVEFRDITLQRLGPGEP